MVEAVVQAIVEEIRGVLGTPDAAVDPDAPLLGDGRLLDSVALVELCLRLEDRAADEGFEFDWTSEEAMSRGRSMFRSVRSLAEEYDRQAGA